MKTLPKFFATGAFAVCLATGAAPAQALTVLTQINQPLLDSTGTGTFGATRTLNGIFTDSFAFTTTGKNSATSSVVTISIKAKNGAILKDIDFSSIFLDSFGFTQTTFDVAHAASTETWSLDSALLSAGPHTITVKGKVVPGTGIGNNAASYAGTLNLTAVGVPEPATWGLMILGFGGVGALLRRRRQGAVFA